MSLDAATVARYREAGHVTVSGLFGPAQMAAAAADAATWEAETLAALDPANEQWYLDAGTGRRVLRKLDNPVHFRPVFRDLAAHPPLIEAVQSLLGGPGDGGLAVWFSQIFLKPSGGGGPKPLHQDNAYFGPNDADGIVNAWIAIDDADEDNGCLIFAEGSHRRPLVPHWAPRGEPFNLQVARDAFAPDALTPAPVKSGGVSFHHGGTAHGSHANTSARPRRAVAMHYVARHVRLVDPALAYDERFIVPIS